MQEETKDMVNELLVAKVKKELLDELDKFLERERTIALPDGYQFKDENGNAINATKIVLEKKPKYPQTYEECCEILEIDSAINHTMGTHFSYRKTIKYFIQLLICRDAYWKIAGEEMGLDRPWKPDWADIEGKKYTIEYSIDTISKSYDYAFSRLLSFPTEEMRDAFYEAFKDLIEECKELL